MHGPIRDGLEDLLNRDLLADQRALAAHLASCAGCVSELDAMKRQAALLANLRGPDVEPPAGFYARVLQRIEEREAVSLWSFFANSTFSRRLAVASLTIALALGSYVVTQESHQQPVIGANFFAFNSGPNHFDAPVMGNPAEQRDAVLANFVVHRVGGGQASIQ